MNYVIIIISKKEINEFEPNVKAILGMYSGSTGIIDSHKYMKSLYEKAERSSQYTGNTGADLGRISGIQ